VFYLVSSRISSFTRAWFDQWLEVAFTKNAKRCKELSYLGMYPRDREKPLKIISMVSKS